MNRTGERILRACFSDSKNIAAGAAAGSQHRFFITNNAAGLGSAAVNSEKKWHDKILNPEWKTIRREPLEGALNQRSRNHVMQGLLAFGEAGHDVAGQKDHARD